MVQFTTLYSFLIRKGAKADFFMAYSNDIIHTFKICNITYYERVINASLPVQYVIRHKNKLYLFWNNQIYQKILYRKNKEIIHFYNNHSVYNSHYYIDTGNIQLLFFDNYHKLRILRYVDVYKHNVYEHKPNRISKYNFINQSIHGTMQILDNNERYFKYYYKGYNYKYPLWIISMFSSITCHVFGYIIKKYYQNNI